MNMQSKLCTQPCSADGAAYPRSMIVPDLAKPLREVPYLQALHAPEASGVGAGRPVRPAGGRSGVVLVSPPSGRAGPLHRLEPGGAAAQPSSNCLQHALSDSAWVKVPHLASHILGRMAARISADWEAPYAHPIYLPETLVDPQRFRGTCYLAANWKVLGETTGRGKDDQTHRPNRSLKTWLILWRQERFPGGPAQTWRSAPQILQDLQSWKKYAALR
jgi:hypothetical protein